MRSRRRYGMRRVGESDCVPTRDTYPPDRHPVPHGDSTAVTLSNTIAYPDVHPHACTITDPHARSFLRRYPHPRVLPTICYDKLDHRRLGNRPA